MKEIDRETEAGRSPRVVNEEDVIENDEPVHLTMNIADPRLRLELLLQTCMHPAREEATEETISMEAGGTMPRTVVVGVTG